MSTCAVCSLEYVALGAADDDDAHVHALVCAQLAALTREREPLAATRQRERIVTLVAAAADRLSAVALVAFMRALDDAVAEHALVRSITCVERREAVHALILADLKRRGVRIGVPRYAEQDTNNDDDDDDDDSVPTTPPSSVSRMSLRSSAASTPTTSPRAFVTTFLSRSSSSPRTQLVRTASARESLEQARDVLDEARRSKSLMTSPVRAGTRPLDAAHDDDDDDDDGLPALLDSRSSSSVASESTRAPLASSVSADGSVGASSSSPRTTRARRVSAPPAFLATRSASPLRADSSAVLAHALSMCECARETASPRAGTQRGRARSRTYIVSRATTTSPRANARDVLLALDERRDAVLATLELHVDGEPYRASPALCIDASSRPEHDLVAAHRLWSRARHVHALALTWGAASASLLARLPLFTSLHALTLSYTPALELEDALFESAPALAFFVARACALTSLPSRLGSARALEYLDVADNALVRWPRSARALTHMRVLVAPRNRLAHAPPIDAWPALVHLDLAENALRRLRPAVRASLPRLAYYSLDGALSVPLRSCVHLAAAAAAERASSDGESTT